jgi:solute carrier family 25 oxoglutarate transporter 11
MSLTNNNSHSLAKTLEPFVCGGSAATFASVIIHPIDLAKVRMQLYGQLNPGKPIPSFPSIIKSIVTRDGPLSVYKGVDAAIGRQMVYGTARIGLHRTFSDKLVELNDGKPISFLQKTLSGMLSGSIAVCIGTPFDIALVRLQSDGMAEPQDRRNYKNVFDALLRTSKEEGVGALYKVSFLEPYMLRSVTGLLLYSSRYSPPSGACSYFPFLQGLLPNILRGMSMNVGMLACYDQAKEVVAALLNDPMTNGPSLPTRLGASATAGFTAALFSLPFDVMKSRLMAMKPNPLTGEMPYKGVVDCAVQMAKNEGPRSFFSGFSAYYGRCAPHAMIILLSIESITNLYRQTFS